MKFRINLKYFCTVFDGKELSLLVWLAILGVLKYLCGCSYYYILLYLKGNSCFPSVESPFLIRKMFNLACLLICITLLMEFI